jgi:ABC-type lipoprotein export system ATPase subunit
VTSDEEETVSVQQSVTADPEYLEQSLSPPSLVTRHSSLVTPLVIAEGLTKIYRRGAETVRALDGVSFELAVGEFAAVVGPSGAGKTTLLHMLGCMDRPTSGGLLLDGCPVDRMSEAELTRTRQQRIGFVFQHFGLMPTLTVAENVGLPNMLAARPLPRSAVRERADALLERVGLLRRREHRPHQLSGGEMQRVAIARALMNSPRLLLADEPTGNLDSGTAAGVVSLLRDLHRDGLTVVVVTHNEALADVADRRLAMADGRLLTA